MKVKDGYKLAMPAFDYMVTSVNEMIDDLYYPSGAFSNFLVGRGRTLNDALFRDPAAPKGLKILTGIYYTKAQIADYIAGYGEGFHDAASELSIAVEKEAGRANAEISAHRAAIEAELDATKSALRTEYAQRMEDFATGFIDAYSRDITATANSTCGVYFLRKGNEIVYIGQSINVYGRVATHRSSKDFDTVEFLPCARDRLDEMEGFFIRLLRPRLNGYDAKTQNGAPKSSIWGEVVTLPWSNYASTV